MAGIAVCWSPLASALTSPRRLSAVSVSSRNEGKRHVSLLDSSPNKLIAPSSSPWPLLFLPLAAVGCLSLASGSALAVEAAESSKNVILQDFLSQEPANALSLPTWTIHVASVVEWAVAMALVWKYGDNPKYAAWKGLTWGMVPLLGGAMCACTWHFFYNAESLEILVVLQAALTMIGNFTMWIAAYRIYLSSSKAL